MAEDLDDGEFWLPSQFLTDDDILMEKKIINTNYLSRENEAKASFPNDFPYGFGFSSSLSSPVESVVGSTETESDEEDYIAGLTLQMAHSTLQDDVKCSGHVFCAERPKRWALAGSPQSTLSAFESWSGCSTSSNRGSSNGHSQVSSPPTMPMNVNGDALDLLYAAAGQVVRMKMNNEGPQYYNGRGLLDPPSKPIPVSARVKNPNTGFYSNQVLTHQQFQRNQFQQLKQQQLMKQQSSALLGRQVKESGTTHQHQHQQQLQNSARTVGYGNGRCGRPLDLSSSVGPPLQHQQQQQTGSGMRAVFLGGSGTRRESCGTGVFLPRRIGNTSDSRKKPACSTVLLPARVVQALNLNLDDMGARFNGGFVPEHGSVMARSNGLLSQQRRNMRPQPAMNHEIRLPQEWTY
ncbi:hypothetical protein HHK36_011101 [Tetracentron sinense]|uniref:TIP41-like protein n=1 Tax=Tetracentron sinense TaxID=13715 RepID=A0A835DH14_TETSI|nr:hypothetical protein HHK36_011101 [Tetracentron sinense]